MVPWRAQRPRASEHGGSALWPRGTRRTAQMPSSAAIRSAAAVAASSSRPSGVDQMSRIHALPTPPSLLCAYSPLVVWSCGRVVDFSERQRGCRVEALEGRVASQVLGPMTTPPIPLVSLAAAVRGSALTRAWMVLDDA